MIYQLKTAVTSNRVLRELELLILSCLHPNGEISYKYCLAALLTLHAVFTVTNCFLEETFNGDTAHLLKCKCANQSI